MHWDSLSHQSYRKIRGVDLNAKYNCDFLTGKKVEGKKAEGKKSCQSAEKVDIRPTGDSQVTW